MGSVASIPAYSSSGDENQQPAGLTIPRPAQDLAETAAPRVCSPRQHSLCQLLLRATPADAEHGDAISGRGALPSPAQQNHVSHCNEEHTVRFKQMR